MNWIMDMREMTLNNAGVGADSISAKNTADSISAKNKTDSISAKNTADFMRFGGVRKGAEMDSAPTGK